MNMMIDAIWKRNMAHAGQFFSPIWDRWSWLQQSTYDMGHISVRPKFSSNTPPPPYYLIFTIVGTVCAFQQWLMSVPKETDLYGV